MGDVHIEGFEAPPERNFFAGTPTIEADDRMRMGGHRGLQSYPSQTELT